MSIQSSTDIVESALVFNPDDCKSSLISSHGNSKFVLYSKHMNFIVSLLMKISRHRNKLPTLMASLSLNLLIPYGKDMIVCSIAR
ncbi:unnamed protein product [Cochlearia groenlandica]